MPQVGLPSAHYGGYGSSPVFSGLTLLNRARNLKSGCYFDDFIDGCQDSQFPSALFTPAYNAGGSTVRDTAGWATRPGILQFSTVIAGGFSGLFAGANQYQSFRLGAGEYTMEGELCLNVNLSIALQEYNLRFGFSTNPFNPTNQEILILYDRLNYGPNWQFVTTSGGARTVQDSGQAVAAGFVWQKLKFFVNMDGTRVDFYLDDVLLHQATLNIPTAVAVTPVVGLIKTAGADDRIFYLDWVWLHYNLAVMR